MTYNNFTIETVARQFELKLVNLPFCESLPSADPQPEFLTIFKQWFRLAETAQSAKAKSELLVSPILAEVVDIKRQRHWRVATTIGSVISIDR